jgi:hypothetical protein
MIDGDDCVAFSGMNEWQGKPKYWEETFPSSALSTTDPTWLQLDSNPGHRGGKPATNLLSYGTAHVGFAEPLLNRYNKRV